MDDQEPDEPNATSDEAKTEAKTDDEGAKATSGDGIRMVECVKFGKNKLGLTKPPLKGDIGKKIYDNISQEAWRMWLEHSKMLINEYRLDLISEQGQQVWMSELEKYFWGEGSELPPDFLPAKAK
jgi:Fe-S cluster biosynthesis and repair protein YggX